VRGEARHEHGVVPLCPGILFEDADASFRGQDGVRRGFDGRRGRFWSREADPVQSCGSDEASVETHAVVMLGVELGLMRRIEMLGLRFAMQRLREAELRCCAV
jgi:hypothetical protein